MMRFTASIVAIIGMWCSSGECFAQRGGRSPERFFRILDQNGDGVIQGKEWDRIPTLRSHLEEMEIDPERGVGLEEFGDISQEFRERMRENGGFRGRRRADDRGDEREERGDRRGSDKEDDISLERDNRDYNRKGKLKKKYRSEESVEDNDRGSTREDRRFEKRDRKRARRSRGQNDTAGLRTKGRSRVTVVLPEKYVGNDKDGDGQIGLYEWSQFEFAEFARLDFNGDGFLTPRELHHSDRSAGNTTVVSTALSRPRETKAARTGRSATTGSKYQRAAEFAFRALDRDKDGTVAAAEWKRSRTTRPMFKKGGVDITQVMSRDAFIENYVRLRSQ